jgi:hypothetical protein
MNIEEFKVDGGRDWEYNDGIHGDCDMCDAKYVPCIYVQAAEDISGSSVCEYCVKRMQAAFDAYKSSLSQENL